MRKILACLTALAAFGIAIPSVSNTAAAREVVVIKTHHHWDRGYHNGWRNHYDWDRGRHYGWRNHYDWDRGHHHDWRHHHDSDRVIIR